MVFLRSGGNHGPSYDPPWDVAVFLAAAVTSIGCVGCLPLLILLASVVYAMVRGI